ncbi:uncharacterized protein METZ01_LOCUS481982, partial [marine metagenome]
MFKYKTIIEQIGFNIWVIDVKKRKNRSVKSNFPSVIQYRSGDNPSH